MNNAETGNGVYGIEANHPFFQANRILVEYEIRPAHTVTFFAEVDLSQIEAIRHAAGERRPSYTAFVAKAVALALREFPYANRRICRRIWLPFLRPRLQRFNQCDVAVACERDVPGAEGVAFIDVLRNVDQLSLDEITAWLARLARCDTESNKQWRDFSGLIRRCPLWLATWLIRLPWMFPSLWVKYRGGAVLISSPAKYGIDGVVATWPWPLGLSFGLVKKRPLVSDGEVVVRPTFTLTVNFDRRIMAGAPAARFFQRIVSLLTEAKRELTSSMPDSFLPPPARPVECL